MGTIQHHVVVATTWDEVRFSAIEEWINEGIFKHSSIVDPNLFESCFVIQPEQVTNGYRTIVFMPDGSKEGWTTSYAGDSIREQFINKLDEYWYWIEAEFGELGEKSR